MQEVRMTAVDRAYRWLQNGIVAEQLPGGSFVDEQTVCDATGVSRTPVREAFHRLAGERYVNLVPRRGAQVRVLTAREMYEVFDMRYVLEGHALRELCQRAAPLPVGMTTALADMQGFGALERLEDQIAYGRLDLAFHRSYVEAVGNTLLLETYDTLRPVHERASLTQARLSSANLRATTTAQHIEIQNALERHDTTAVLAHLAEHLRPIPELGQLPGGAPAPA